MDVGDGAGASFALGIRGEADEVAIEILGKVDALIDIIFWIDTLDVVDFVIFIVHINPHILADGAITRYLAFDNAVTDIRVEAAVAKHLSLGL